MIFIDTNYFLRFLLRDVKGQFATAKKLFQEGVEGKVDICTSIIVFFEIFWVLSSFYKRQKGEVVKILEKILAMEFIQLEERLDLHNALQIFAAHSIELEDAYHLVYARKIGVKEFRTFDQKLSMLFSTQ